MTAQGYQTIKIRDLDKWLLVAGILYYSSIFIADTIPGGSLLQALLLAVMLVLGYGKNTGRISLHAAGFFVYILLFTFYCMLSRIWAEDPTLAAGKINSLLFMIIGMVVMVWCYHDTRDMDSLLKIIMYGGYVVVIYMFLRYGYSGIHRLLVSHARISNDVLNANTIGMCAAYAMVINIYYILYDHLKVRDVLMIPALALLAASGSRKAILIVMVGFVGIFVLKNAEGRKMSDTVFKVLVALAAAVVLLIILSRLPAFSTVAERMKNLVSLLQGNESRRTSDAWIRIAYMRLGMELFRAHPILGIGIANANIYTMARYGHNHYLHNNYVEMLACGGLVGFLLYYSVYFYLIGCFVRRHKSRDRFYVICLVLLALHMAMDFGIVSYYGKETYVFLLLFFMEAQRLRAAAKKHPKKADMTI